MASSHFFTRGQARLVAGLATAFIFLPMAQGVAAPGAPTIVVPPPVSSHSSTPAAPAMTGVGGAAMGDSLTRYQMALDRLILGETATARLLLQEGIRKNGNQPELNMLLGYILQREGQPAEAQKWLAPASPASPLVAEYSNRLSNLATVAAPSVGSSSTAATKPSYVSLDQSDARLEKLEQSFVDLVNAERQKNGLEVLVIDRKLATVSRAHSAEMRDFNYFAHESPNPALRTLVERYRAVFNSTPRMVAENIHKAWGSRRKVPDQQDVEKAHSAFMNSPSHRENVLNPRVTRIGIGIVTNDNGDIWVTQMFSRI